MQSERYYEISEERLWPDVVYQLIQGCQATGKDLKGDSNRQLIA